MIRHLPRAVRVLGQAALLGLTLLGTVTSAITLRLAPGWGLLTLTITTGTGLLCLAVPHAAQTLRIRSAQARTVRRAEAWLREACSRTKDAE